MRGYLVLISGLHSDRVGHRQMRHRRAVTGSIRGRPLSGRPALVQRFLGTTPIEVSRCRTAITLVGWSGKPAEFLMQRRWRKRLVYESERQMRRRVRREKQIRIRADVANTNIVKLASPRCSRPHLSQRLIYQPRVAPASHALPPRLSSSPCFTPAHFRAKCDCPGLSPELIQDRSRGYVWLHGIAVLVRCVPHSVGRKVGGSHALKACVP
jgi:hypothetical protein